jgi:hypothetical protein
VVALATPILHLVTDPGWFQDAVVWIGVGIVVGTDSGGVVWTGGGVMLE